MRACVCVWGQILCQMREVRFLGISSVLWKEGLHAFPAEAVEI